MTEEQDFGQQVPISFAANKMNSELLTKVTNSHLFKQWRNRCNKQQQSGNTSEFQFHGIEIQSVDLFDNDKVGALKCKVDVSRKKAPEKKIPGITLIRGKSVAVLVVLTEIESRRKYVVLTKQPRIAACSFQCLEIPAGMMEDAPNFAEKAVEELREETGIEAAQDELVDLTAFAFEEEHMKTDPHLAETAATGSSVEDAQGVMIAPDVCDESCRMFLLQRDMHRSQIDELKGKKMGNEEEGEVIEVEVLPLDKVWRMVRDCKLLAALLLYNKFMEN